MRYLKDQSGIALLMALILSVVALTFSAALIYIITQGTRMSGLEKRYSTALGAAKGGAEIATKVVQTAGTAVPDFCTLYTPDNCWDEKLYVETPEWAACTGGWTDPDPTVSPDLVCSLGDYNVFIKLVETVWGNTQLSRQIYIGRGVVENIGGPGNIPAFVRQYVVEVHSEHSTSPDENADLTILYAH